MAQTPGIQWTCDVATCKNAVFKELEDNNTPPADWVVHIVDGQSIVCCPDHHKAFVSMVRYFIQDVSVDMQGLIEAYEG